MIDSEDDTDINICRINFLVDSRGTIVSLTVLLVIILVVPAVATRCLVCTCASMFKSIGKMGRSKSGLLCDASLVLR
jgi:hypothetical protein